MLNDLRYALRSLRKAPGFTAAAVLTLALGIGANSTIFSIINPVLLRPLPYPESERIVSISRVTNDGDQRVVMHPEFLAWERETRSFERLAAYMPTGETLTGAGDPEELSGARVSADFFQIFRAQPILGRLFTSEEQVAEASVVLLSHALWVERFGAAPGVLGRTISLSGQPATVIGVLPPGFTFPGRARFWKPLSPPGSAAGVTWYWFAIGRLQPGVSLERAETELAGIQRRVEADLFRSLPPSERRAAVRVITLHERLYGDARPALLMLLGAVGFVLLIACANVANLQLARAAARQREMAVRAALGAGRWRIARERLTESVLLSVTGGGLGLLVAFWGVRALGQWNGASLPAMQGIGIDAWVLAFTLGVSVITGLVFGLAPAVQAGRTDVNTALKEEGRGDSGGHRNRLRHLLVVSEVGLALVLLIGAGLLIKSFSRLMAVNPGFRTDGVLTFQVTLTEGKSSAQKINFTLQIIERLKALPGVQAAAATDSLPLTPFTRITLAEIDGRPAIDVNKLRRGELKVRPASRATVTYDYFNAMGIQVKNGRLFTPQDARPTAGVAIVNEAFEKHHFPGQSAIGKRIRLRAGRGEARWQTVVGVVSDVRQSGLAGDVMLEVYSPELEDTGDGLSFVMRVAGEPARLISAVRAVVAEVEPNQAIHNLMTMEQRLANTTTSRRLNTALVGSFAAVALLLAVVGIYGVMSYDVEQRTHEIGIRMALGAQTADVLRMVVRQGMALAAIGIGVGLFGAFWLSQFLSTLLFEISPTDRMTFLLIPLVVALIVLCACLIPARRATKVDPLEALRYE